MQPPTLIHVDDAMIVADKPAGLLAVPGRGPERADCLAARVQTRYADALVVHRLDMGTSGLIVFARGLQAQRHLGTAFAERRVHKVYVAIVAGIVGADAGEIDLPLITDWPHRPRQMVDHARGKPSLTRWRVLERHDAPDGAQGAGASRTRLELSPVTGRSHQLRVHLMAMGHPIVGDELYAPPALAAAAPRLLLHAHQLALPHPVSGHTVAFCSPMPF
ncbi:MAG: RluA family pseudouridine synthase [Aquabacterium sp.]|jgi:tRNA pseudouridine32 synthase/23S rRNA pseudouridine746 synthase|nr:RluA family pseudouridine synthase [Aquabacterium sp.]